MNKQRAVLFVNGQLENPELIKKQLLSEDWIVAVDGGLNHLTQMGLLPDLLMGDLDSADSSKIVELIDRGIEVIQYPVEKDETDLELALLHVVKQGIRVIRIFGALGGRLDQTLGNLYLLTMPELLSCDVRIETDSEQVFAIRSKAEIDGKPGDRISLIPLHGEASGIQTKGLQYPLKNEILKPDRTRGISNVMLEDHAVISLEKGLLLCIHSTRNR